MKCAEADGFDTLQVRDDWIGRSAAWNRWSEHLAKTSARFNEPLLLAAGAGPGVTTLDLASGTGEPALTAATMVGNDGLVVATDLVPAMIEGCRRRALNAGATALVAVGADMQQLPFGEGMFEAVTSRFGIMFAPRPDEAVAEALRVLRPMGRAAFMSWGPEKDTTMFEVLRRELRGNPELAEDPGLSRPFRFGEEGGLAGLLGPAGFIDIEEEGFHYQTEIEMREGFWMPHLEMALGDRLESMPEQERRKIERGIEESFKVLQDGDRIKLKAHVRIGSGVRPG